MKPKKVIKKLRDVDQVIKSIKSIIHNCVLMLLEFFVLIGILIKLFIFIIKLFIFIIKLFI